MTWIFTYGSLMGDNALRYHQGTPAKLAGFHRSFIHASVNRWGTPEHPCPILGLVPEGECWGVAFEVPKRERRDVLRNLERREGQDEYRRAEVRIQVADRAVEAVAWVSKPEFLNNRRRPQNPQLLEEEFLRARGLVGTGIEYVRTLIHAMERWKIHDSLVESLWHTLEPHSYPRG